MNLPNECGELLAAIQFACEKHKNQRRKDQNQTPYINHPIGVMNILWNEANVRDVHVLMAAVLHDTVEDTETTEEELEKHFGAQVKSIVMECTDDKSLAKEERKRLQIVNAKKKSDKARLVKMADKLYNLRDLKSSTPVGWSLQRIQEYFVWAKSVTENFIGLNPLLDAKLSEVYSSTFIFEGIEYPCIPK